MEDADADAAAMAEAMGFSSFGTQASNKRRKFNPATDAVVDGAPTATSVAQASSRAVGGPMSSGSNSTPLGTRTQNKDEIALDVDNDDDDDVAGHDSAGGAAIAQSPSGADGPEPQSTQDWQAKIDSIVGASEGRHPQLPARPVAGPAMQGSHGTRGGYQSGRGSGRGMGREPGKMWWEGYYDPSSVINPWERLEKEKGLEPRGEFLSWEEAKR